MGCLPPHEDERSTVFRQAGRVACMAIGFMLPAGSAQAADAAYDDWPHAAPLWIVTTPEGADLPASCAEKDFPLLVRLSGETFDFSQANATGEDIRFSDATGRPLPFQIDEWDAALGTASIWVRIPLVKGNDQQRITMHWGKADADGATTNAAVFAADNGFTSVLHMGRDVRDETGGISPVDRGTSPADGVIGTARHFVPGKGITGGEGIAALPKGKGPFTTEAWFRVDHASGRLVAWGQEKSTGNKVIVEVVSPPRIFVECNFANVLGKTPLSLRDWHHVAHTFADGESRVYIDGRLDGKEPRSLDIPETSRFFIGGWYDNYSLTGDVDEVRISHVARSADWIRLEHENQKPLQSLVGPPVTGEGSCAVSPTTLTVAEGKQARVTATPGGARKFSWSLVRHGEETVVAVDRPAFTLDAGRVVGDESLTLRLRALLATGPTAIDVPVTILEAIPDPEVSLRAPATWNGREPIEILFVVDNRAALEQSGAGDCTSRWSVSGGAVTREVAPDRLILRRSQYSGPITVRCTVDNGGSPVTAEATIMVTEPDHDPWIERNPDTDEQPQDGQFYARDDRGQGTLVYNGMLDDEAGSVFLDVFADGQPYATESLALPKDRSYAFTVRLKPGLVTYSVEFGTGSGATRKVLRSVKDLVCGDAFIIEGQSNALATDTHESAPRETSAWIRSYGGPAAGPAGDRPNLWCRPVWKREKPEETEIGWWGMVLAKRLVETRKIPVCIINGAVGGTRIDQHQRNDADPTDPGTIYGRLLSRVRQARLTHGIRAILWHQGENNQGSAGPTGDYDWKSYQDFFLELAADWKDDFPNLAHYYLFQIWPNACSMASGGSGNMLRERQRTLPRLFSHMDILSTVGVTPRGDCHFPLAGWAEFARLVHPLIERDFHAGKVSAPITAPNLLRAWLDEPAGRTVVLEFDQPVVWRDVTASQIHVDGAPKRVIGGSTQGNLLRLSLDTGPVPGRITYLEESSWDQQRLLVGANGIAALTFCDVPLGGTAAAR